MASKTMIGEGAAFAAGKLSEVDLRPVSSEICDDEQVTYSELSARANQLVSFLRGIGVEPESLVALSAPSAPDISVGLLGIAEAGGIYPPFDPANPCERLRRPHEKVRPAALVTVEPLLTDLPELGGPRLPPTGSASPHTAGSRRAASRLRLYRCLVPRPVGAELDGPRRAGPARSPGAARAGRGWGRAVASAQGPAHGLHFGGSRALLQRKSDV